MGALSPGAVRQRHSREGKMMTCEEQFDALVRSIEKKYELPDGICQNMIKTAGDDSITGHIVRQNQAKIRLYYMSYGWIPVGALTNMGMQLNHWYYNDLSKSQGDLAFANQWKALRPYITSIGGLVSLIVIAHFCGLRICEKPSDGYICIGKMNPEGEAFVALFGAAGEEQVKAVLSVYHGEE
jgi:hypothetical protein